MVRPTFNPSESESSGGLSGNLERESHGVRERAFGRRPQDGRRCHSKYFVSVSLCHKRGRRLLCLRRSGREGMSAGRAAPRGRYARWGKAGELRITPVVPGIPEHAGRAARGPSPGYRGSQIFLKKGGVDRLSFLTCPKICTNRSCPNAPRAPTSTVRSRARAARRRSSSQCFSVALPPALATVCSPLTLVLAGLGGVGFRLSNAYRVVAGGVESASQPGTGKAFSEKNPGIGETERAGSIQP